MSTVMVALLVITTILFLLVIALSVCVIALVSNNLELKKDTPRISNSHLSLIKTEGDDSIELNDDSKYDNFDIYKTKKYIDNVVASSENEKNIICNKSTEENGEKGYSIIVYISKVDGDNLIIRKTVDDPIQIGSGGNADICIQNDDRIKRRHCEIFKSSAGGLFIIGIGNGFFWVNEEVVDSEHKVLLNNNDIITIGNTKMRISID